MIDVLINETRAVISYRPRLISLSRRAFRLSRENATNTEIAGK